MKTGVTKKVRWGASFQRAPVSSPRAGLVQETIARRRTMGKLRVHVPLYDRPAPKSASLQGQWFLRVLGIFSSFLFIISCWK